MVFWGSERDSLDNAILPLDCLDLLEGKREGCDEFGIMLAFAIIFNGINARPSYM